MLKVRFFFTGAVLLIALLTALSAQGETTAPDEFSFSGGSGRIKISCGEVDVSDDGALARIVFSSPHYTQVRVGDAVYETQRDGAQSEAWIPVTVNGTTTIYATTVAMSSPHEIEYRLYIGIDALKDDARFAGLAVVSKLPLRYAEMFDVYFLEDGCALIEVGDGARYLVVPEGGTVPGDLSPDVAVIRRPVGGAYLAATSAMSMFDALDALDAIRFVSMEKQDWYIPGAAAALEDGRMAFAGKYDTPDYEMLVKQDCGLAIESTMILRAPKVREMLELLGIPVFVDYSSYESHPLGRMEWIKLYGVLTGKPAEAEAFFDEEASAVECLGDPPSGGGTVVFFYINSNGSAVVRGPSDYVVRMIEMAGGEYVFGDIEEPLGARSSVTLSMEDFYIGAAEADFLIYNAAIDEAPRSVQELIKKNGLLEDFKAVREGRVWCADRSMYQAAATVGRFIADVHAMLGGETEGMTFMYHLD